MANALEAFDVFLPSQHFLDIENENLISQYYLIPRLIRGNRESIDCEEKIKTIKEGLWFSVQLKHLVLSSFLWQSSFFLRNRNRGMNVFRISVYRTTCFFTSVIGQWPYQKTRNRLLLRIGISITIIHTIIIHVYTLYTSTFDKNTVIDVLPILVSEAACMAKYLHCWIHNKTIKNLLEDIKTDWHILEVKEELDILYTYAEKGKLYEIYYVFMIYAGIMMFLVVPFIPTFLDIIVPLNESRPHTLPLRIEYFVDKEKYFYLLLGHINVTVFIVLTALLGSDTIFITLLSHACGLFSVLGYKLQHIFDDADNSAKIYINVATCVKYHKRVLKFMETIRSCYNVFYLFQFIFAMLISTVLLLHIFISLSEMQNIGETVVCTLHLIGYYLVVLYNIIPAQRLMDKSDTIFHKAYCGNWYIASPKTQKMLLLIMQCSRKPIGVTIIYVLDLSFEMYAAMIQTSLSYFTVLYSIQ